MPPRISAVGHLVAVLVDNLDLDTLKGNARPVAVPFQAMLGGNCQVGAAFGRAVAFAQF